MTNTNNYFAAKAAMKKINKAVAAKHPDWDSKKVYAVTGSIYRNRFANTEATDEAVAEAVEAEAVEAETAEATVEA